jgi:lauroyl/myristoyl acyltransferase
VTIPGVATGSAVRGSERHARVEVRGRDRPAWVVRYWLHVLDFLPWPWGEDACAAVFAFIAIVRPVRLRKALGWAAVHAGPGRTRLRLAMSVCAFAGRVRGRHALLGIRSPTDLCRQVRIVGGDHLPRTGGAILLGFHLGSPVVGEALCAAGIRVSPVGGVRCSRSWSSPAWTSVRSRAEGFLLSETTTVLGGLLYRARRRLLGGDTVYITADGLGRVAFSIALPGAPALSIKSGWLALRRECGVPVLPVLSHLEGRTQVIVIHPPLPVDQDRQREVESCRDVLSVLLTEFARDFPEQCSGVVFR